MTLPDFESLPDSLTEGAAWIWRWQDRLNAVAMSIGTGTIAIGLGNDKSLQRDTLQKFLRAFAAEFAENMENFYWKHWSKECREGRYFQLVETGDQLRENRAQNVKVELVDMLFFLVSYLQVAGYPEERWTIHWGNSRGFDDGMSLSLGRPHANRGSFPVRASHREAPRRLFASLLVADHSRGLCQETGHQLRATSARPPAGG
jgi:hypothetical protein